MGQEMREERRRKFNKYGEHSPKRGNKVGEEFSVSMSDMRTRGNEGFKTVKGGTVRKRGKEWKKSQKDISSQRMGGLLREKDKGNLRYVVGRGNGDQ